MNLNSIGSYPKYPTVPTFKGNVLLETYEAGVKTVQSFVTKTSMDDYALKIAADSLVGKDSLSLISKEQASSFATIIKNITGMEIKESTQQRGMINNPDKIIFRDLDPEKDGIKLTITDLKL